MPPSFRCSGSAKTACGECDTVHRTFYDQSTRKVLDLDCGGRRIYLEFSVRRVACWRCEKRERLERLADNPHITQRFAIRVGRFCGLATIKDVAEDFHLDWHTVKELDLQYMYIGNRAASFASVQETKDMRMCVQHRVEPRR